MGDIGIVGRSLGIYDVLIGGDGAGTRMNEPYATNVREDAIAPLLRELFAAWVREGDREERFGDFVYRIGIEDLRDRIDRVAAPA
jgi:sulfite reductase beta subunit-like hemoprotein